MNKRTRRNKRAQQVGLITNIIFCLITLSALTGCIVLLLQNYTMRNESVEAMGRIEELEGIASEYIYSQKDLDAHVQEAAQTAAEQEKNAILGGMKRKILEGESTVSVFRELFTEDVVVYADSKYHFFPISDSLKKHNYVYENFIERGNEIVYTDESQKIASFKGIDVSRHQGEINWSMVPEDEISYAFIRAGYRGNSEGKLIEDEYFKDNIEGALEHNIDVGIYFYTQALTEEEAVEEAEFVLELIEDYEITYPVVLDLEEVADDSARTSEMTKEEYTKAAIAFCETIRKAGYTPMIYGNLKTFMIMLDMEQIEAYDKWFAYYDTTVYFPYDFTIWQYSSNGSVKGIGGNVDMNVCMKDYSHKN